ncbi:hypothetical protein [Salipiger abyssi]|uniref:hypothetical protein n=1 Tax=Salipiger abyssi TaxID=1250539 RepID=UPI0012EC9CEB|nr:hypothetical protein [Salipiger abyssi]
MSVTKAPVVLSVCAPFGPFLMRFAQFDCGTRFWSLRVEGAGPDAPPVVNGPLDGAHLDAMIADFETALCNLRQFRDVVTGAQDGAGEGEA